MHAITVAVFDVNNILMEALTLLLKIVRGSTPSCYNCTVFLLSDSRDELWDQTQIVEQFSIATLGTMAPTEV